MRVSGSRFGEVLDCVRFRGLEANRLSRLDRLAWPISL